MENQLLNKRNLIILFILLLLICAVIWIFLPKFFTSNNSEMFTLQEQETKEGTEPIPEDKNLPYVNPKTGSLIDGPGFERGGDIEGVTQEVMAKIPSNYYFLDDGADGEMSIQHNLCSKSCCSAQWPTPFKQKYDPYVCGNEKSKFSPSNIFCSNSFQDSGCLCLTKKQAQFFYNRGGNGRELF